MRIIAGDKRGSRVQTLGSEETRPTLERVKEAVFSSVQFILPGAEVLDLFAGSGQLGLESLSRGAKHCVFVENNAEVIPVIKNNIAALHYKDACDIMQMNALVYLAQCKRMFDIAFLDPPYNSGLLPQVLPKLAGLMNSGGVVLCESTVQADLPSEIDGLFLKKQYRYSKVQISRYIKE